MCLCQHLCKLSQHGLTRPIWLIGLLRPRNRGNISCNVPCNNVALQVEFVCCTYYHLCAQIFMLKKVEATSTFCNMKICLHKKVLICATNNLNVQRNIVARKVLRKCCPCY